MSILTSRGGVADCNAAAVPAVFAFYGRVSTEDNQDPESSRNWQQSLASNLIRPRGGHIGESFVYFDIGQSRSLPWQRRPQASRLLAALANPHRGFDAVVIGEPHRAFYGNQFGLTVPLFTHYGVQLWVPEVGGPIDPDNEAHDLVMSVFGGMSKGERNRIKIRVRTAMASQTLMEGRYLGGRPPYGYQLHDLGPHPNPAKAATGGRLRGLAPDPATAPIVHRIFAEFLDGNGLHLIAEGLTRDGIPCPSAYDRARNPHRTGLAWAKNAVRVILTNPRYTGRQAWNKQRTDEVLLDVNDVALGHTSVMRWNPTDRWIISTERVHEPLVDDEIFTQAQQVLARRARSGAPHRSHRTRYPYLFRHLVYCTVCDRRMQGQYSHGAAYYRCRFPQEYGLANKIDHPRNVYLREDALIEPLDRWLLQIFAPQQRSQTIAAIHDAAKVGQPERTEPAVPVTAGLIAECDAKIARYRQALDAGADPAVVAGWIAETQATRQRYLEQLSARPVERPQPEPLAVAQIEELLAGLGDLVGVLRDAEPEHKLGVYAALKLRLDYEPETQTVRANVDLGQHRGGLVSVRGGTRTPTDRVSRGWRVFM